MIWLALALLAVCALAPLAVALEGGTVARGAREPAIALHRTQLQELDRDLAEGRILPAEHASAMLEVQRRLLHAADTQERAAQAGSRMPVLLAAVLVPAVALALYLQGGSPWMPSITPGSGEARQQRQMEDAALLAQLRERLAAMDPRSDQARTGYILLGNVESARGNDAAAAQAWRTALAARFDPLLAVRAAEAATRAESSISASSAGLLRRALAAAPADAPWRGAVEQQLRQAGP